MSLIDWLKVEVPSDKLFLFMAKSAAYVLLCSFLGALLMQVLGVNISANAAPLGEMVATMPIGNIFFLLVIAATGEELIFRAPLFIPAALGYTGLVLPMTVIISAIFGWVHGGFGNILIQGGGGFIFSLVFLKCGGMQRKFFRGLGASAGTHLLFNLWLVGILYLSTQ